MPSQIAINAAGERLDTMRVKSQVARCLLAVLESECKVYCVLSGYDHLPESFDTDIDFMVDADDFQRLPRSIEQVARNTRTRLFQVVEHEISARSYTLGFQSEDRVVLAQLDASADYRHFGLLWLRASELLAARRIHPRGFWIPAPAHEFIYYLIKKINKSSLNDEQALKLHRLYLEDPAGCDAMLARFWKGSSRDSLIRMASTNIWLGLQTNMESFRAELRRHPADTLTQRIASSPARLHHHLGRVISPTGGCIAIMGPDGAGKSAVIEAIQREFRPAYNKINCFHLRPKALRASKTTTSAVVTDPHGKPPRGFILSVLKVFFMIADYWLGYVLKIAPALRRSQLIVFDRYIYDLLVDCKRVRYGGPAWLLRLAARVVPSPDLVVLLDAPAEVLWSRKQEVSFEEVKRQRKRYREVCGELSLATTVNAAQPLSDVIRDVNAAIIAYYERRTAERLRLQIPPLQPDSISVEASRPRC